MGGDDQDYKRYRYQVVDQFPELKFLDSTPVTPFEKSEAKRLRAYLKVAKYNPEKDKKKDEDKEEKKEEADQYAPLPQDLAKLGNHRGSFGVCKYVYYGRNSEGNRFIRNSDL